MTLVLLVTLSLVGCRPPAPDRFLTACGYVEGDECPADLECVDGFCTYACEIDAECPASLGQYVSECDQEEGGYCF